VTTLGAGLGGVVRIDDHDLLSHSFDLILYERKQLVERPAAQHTVERLVPLRTTNGDQVLENEDDLRLVDDLVGHAMDQVPNEPSLSPTHLLQFTMSGASAFGL
jgi:hypothetical protein